MKTKAMENNELEEMRSQLSVLNEKLDKEPIVSDTMLSNVTRKSISGMQRKLLVRILIGAVLAYFVYVFFGLWIAGWLLGVMVLNIYVFIRSRNMNSKPVDVADNIRYIRKTLKVYKKCRKALFIFFALWLVLLGGVCLAFYWGTVRGVTIFCYCIISDIFLASLYYVIDDVFVKPDVENTLESILKDLES